MKTDLRNRTDVALLVRTFYGKVRRDETLGPVFNTIITDWEEHLEKLTDFWEMNLFGGRGYGGNPILAHREVDAAMRNTIEAWHFGIWLNLWFETLHELFEGDNTEALMRRARKMQTPILVAIYEGRKA